MSLPTTTTTTTNSSAATTTTNSSASTTTTAAGKTYSSRDAAWECMISVYVITLLSLLICATPAITRLLIFLQPNVSIFKVHSSSLSILNISSTTIIADWDVAVLVNNPNKKNMFYSEISGLALKNGSSALSTITLLPFGQKGFEKDRLIEAKFSEMVVQLLDDDRNGSFGFLNLTVEIQSLASYGGWTWPVKRDKFKVVCEDFKVGFLLNVTTLNSGSSTCYVNGQWKILVAKCTQIFWNYVYISVIVLGILALSL